MPAKTHDTVQALVSRLDLTRPDLAAVRSAVEAGDLDAAAEAFAAHLRDRQEPAYPRDPRSREKHSLSESQREEADAALENRFIGQSKYGLQKVPEPIDWGYNPGKDPEWTWQFNRHSAWRALAEAYLATGNEAYAEKWVSLLRDWVAKNPPGTKLSWRTLEAGGRCQSWLAVYFSFINYPGFTPHDHALMINSLAEHAEYLMPENRFRSGSNWGLSESRGLLSVGTIFPEFKDALRWRETAWKRIEGEMFIQVLEDGAQVELTTSYHQGTVRGFAGAPEIARLGGVEPSPAYWARLEKMYEYTMFLQKPDGTQPMLGDSWPDNTRRIVAEGGRRFNRPDMRYVGSSGEEGAAPDFLDTQLPAAGYYVMRTDWVDPQAIYLFTDVAHRWGGGHQQPDALQINLYAYGKTLLPDSGSYLYYGPDRKRFARTSSHSTVVIDDENQSRDAAICHCFSSADALSFVDGSHQGYEGVTHRRQVLFARPVDGIPPYFLVIDRITGEGVHTADQYFHFLPGPMELEAGKAQARTAHPGGANVLVQAVGGTDVALEEVASWVSFVYTQKQPRPAVRYRQAGALPLTFVTLILPYEGVVPPELSVTEMASDRGAGAIAVRVKGTGFQDLLFAQETRAEIVLPGLTATARAGLVRTHSDGKEVRKVLVEGDLP